MTHQEVPPQQIQRCLEYIDSYWNKIILDPQKLQKKTKQILRLVKRYPGDTDQYHIIELPHTAILSNDKKYQYVFYWDNYFSFRGLLDTKRSWVILDMVKNFAYLFKKYHIIPTFNHPEALGRSQAPFFSSMVLDGFQVLTEKNKKNPFALWWLKKYMKVAKTEYLDVWESLVSVDHKHYNHKVEAYQLNRYGDRDVGYGMHAEQESGWDMTSRFYNRCHEFLPIDLNSFLYVYEQNFATAAQILKNTEESNHWSHVAQQRKERMQIFWNEEKGFFYDYDYVHHLQSEFESLAGFVPLWARLATPEQAQKMVQKLPLFETEFGLTVTTKGSLPNSIDLSHVPEPLQITLQEVLKPKQWDYPNIWPPLEYLTVIGLLQYGYLTEATRIMQKSIKTHCALFEKYHAMVEKVDGLTGDMPGTYWYPTQLGFGWTNAIFYRYIKILRALQNEALEWPRKGDLPARLPITY